MIRENPLANQPAGISNTAIFRKIAFVGGEMRFALCYIREIAVPVK